MLRKFTLKSRKEKSQRLKWINGLKATLNVLRRGFSSLYGCGGPHNKEKPQIRELLNIRQVQSFLISFFLYKYNTGYKEYKCGKSKTDSQWHRQPFKEITGQPDRQNRLAQVPKIFGDKILSFFCEYPLHVRLLSLGSVGESSWGNYGNFNGIRIFKNESVWGKRV